VWRTLGSENASFPPPPPPKAQCLNCVAYMHTQSCVLYNEVLFVAVLFVAVLFVFLLVPENAVLCCASSVCEVLCCTYRRRVVLCCVVPQQHVLCLSSS
jgi:hypothetical protein